MQYTNDGMMVWVRFKNRFVPAVVLCAMGNTARVCNEVLGLDTWYNVSEMFSKKPEKEL